MFSPTELFANKNKRGREREREQANEFHKNQILGLGMRSVLFCTQTEQTGRLVRYMEISIRSVKLYSAYLNAWWQRKREGPNEERITKRSGGKICKFCLSIAYKSYKFFALDLLAVVANDFSFIWIWEKAWKLMVGRRIETAIEWQSMWVECLLVAIT